MNLHQVTFWSNNLESFDVLLGLDSNTAFSVVESLKRLAIQKNSTVIMTAHQPSGRLYELFDQVCSFIFHFLPKVLSFY